MDADAFLAHYGVKGMRWGVRKKERVKTPMTDREKVMLGSLVASGVLLSAAGLTMAGLNIRKNQYKIRSATLHSWVENLVNGDTSTYQNVKPETFREVYPKGKEAFNLIKQHARNNAMLDYYFNE